MVKTNYTAMDLWPINGSVSQGIFDQEKQDKNYPYFEYLWDIEQPEFGI